MKHAREDYNRIQDPAGLIGEEEPVFLLRAKDQLAPDTLRFWADSVERYGDSSLAWYVRCFADEMEAWQKENSCKLPDMP